MTGWKKEFWRYLLLFLAGYCVYLAIEVTFRGYSFRLMGLTGGAAMVILGFLLRRGMGKLQLPVQMLIGSGVITGLELAAGLFSLEVLGIRMWDYGDEWMSLCGNLICPRYSVYWYFLSGVAILFTDAVDYWMFGTGRRPRYRIFRWYVSLPELWRMSQETSAERGEAENPEKAGRERAGREYYRSHGK